MLLTSYSASDITEKKVLLRLDLDVSENNLRLERAGSTIKELLDFKAKAIIICGHRGRPAKPEDRLAAEFSLKPVGEKLENILNKLGVQEKINVINEIEPVIGTLPGKLIMLENLRFWSGEKNNDSEFAAKLALWGDVYVNDAFSVSHRNDASLVAITKIMDQCFAGRNLIKEINEQEKFITNANSGLVVVLGGIKISTKLPLIKSLSPKADVILLGGGLANTVIASRGGEVGQSIIEPDMFTAAQELSDKIVLPEDFMVLNNAGQISEVLPQNITKTDFIIDIGPKTITKFTEKINNAKFVLWNGPMGKFEDKNGSVGTEAIAQVVANCNGKTLAGGGDTVVALERLDLIKKIGFVSVGGGALLTNLSNEPMPAIEALLSHRN